MAQSTESTYRDERARLRERIRNTDFETERRETIHRLTEINCELHAGTYAKLARE